MLDWHLGCRLHLGSNAETKKKEEVRYLIGNSVITQSGGTVNVSGTVSARSFTGDGTALTNVNAATLGGLSSSAFAANEYRRSNHQRQSELHRIGEFRAHSARHVINAAMDATRMILHRL